jgi:hypothetical protein
VLQALQRVAPQWGYSPDLVEFGSKCRAHPSSCGPIVPPERTLAPSASWLWQPRRQSLEAEGLVKLNKVTTEGVGTSYRLELTVVGQTRVSQWLAHGH